MVESALCDAVTMRLFGSGHAVSDMELEPPARWTSGTLVRGNQEGRVQRCL